MIVGTSSASSTTGVSPDGLLKSASSRSLTAAVNDSHAARPSSSIDSSRKWLSMAARLGHKDRTNKFLARFGAYSPKKMQGHSTADAPVNLEAKVGKVVCSGKHGKRRYQGMSTIGH